ITLMGLLRLFMIVTLTTISFIVTAQPWMKGFEKKQGTARNFYDVQKAFNQYWEGKTIERGKGWKQFKRWENFMEPRVYPSGILPYRLIFEELMKQKDMKSLEGDWIPLGPFDTPLDIGSSGRSGSGRINCIEFHPTDQDIFWVGSPSGGVWKTTDGGNSWITTTDHLPAIGISDIAVDPANPDILYLATGDGDASDTYSIGILKSVDGGLTWDTTGSGIDIHDYYTFRRILINPDSTNIIIAASNKGILRSADYGSNWNTVINGDFRDIEFKPGDPSIVYIGNYNGSGATILKSTDGGQSFTQSSSGISPTFNNRFELAVTPANPSKVYALGSRASNDGLGGVYVSGDEGATWTLLLSGTSMNLLGWSESADDAGGQGWYDLALAVSPVNEDEIYVGGVNIWKSSDGGNNWDLNAHWYGGGGAEYVHADQHSFDFNPLNNILYAGNDGGVYKTSDGGANWTDISDGLEILQIYRMGASFTDSTRAIAGAQDNGSMMLDGSSWFSVLGGDGMECIIDYTDADVIYGEYYYGSIYKSTNGGNSFSSITPQGAGDGAWITPFIIDSENPDILYAGYKEVYKTTNGGGSWTKMTSNLTSGSLFLNLAVAPNHCNNVYAATSYRIWRSHDSGMTWSEMGTNFPNYPITSIAVAPYNPDHLWISMSGYHDGHKVYKTTDGGQTWSNISDSLPNIPANCIVYEENTNGTVYLGTDAGVYYRDNTMNYWSPFSNGLPNVIVSELEIHYPTEKIRAATYGRGMWESELYRAEYLPSAAFEYLVTSPCSGTVEFYDLSGGIPSGWNWDFGDGITSSLKNPEHTFQDTGTYQVQLIVTNSFGTDTLISDVYLAAGSLSGDFSAENTQFCIAPADVQFQNLYQEGLSYFWDFGDGTTATDIHPLHTYNSMGIYDVMLVVSAPLCPGDTSVKPAYIIMDNSVSAEYTMNQYGLSTTSCCTGTLFDSGGQDDYPSGCYSFFVISPDSADHIILTFNEFDIEEGDNGSCNNDYVSVYDGPNLMAPLIGKYCNTTGSPGTIESTNSAITIRFFSDSGTEGAGFTADWHCVMTSAQDINQMVGVNVFPNPGEGNFTFETSGQNEKISCIKIYSYDGRLVYQSVENVMKERAILNLSGFESGVYIAEVLTEKGRYRVKIVRQ
ncbi:MAG: PKD domain-containing protein, partial [Bacteroidota bacterium]